jgi:hypothetical protein
LPVIRLAAPAEPAAATAMQAPPTARYFHRCVLTRVFSS